MVFHEFITRASWVITILWYVLIKIFFFLIFGDRGVGVCVYLLMFLVT